MDIEEDIKILENLKKYLNLLIYEGTHKIIYNNLGWDEKTIDCINAIDHILAKIEEDKKKIKELKIDNRKLETLRIENDYGYENIHFITENKLVSIDTNKYLIEIENGKFVDIKQVYLDNKNSISKQKIKDILLKYAYVNVDDSEKIIQFYAELKKIVEEK